MPTIDKIEDTDLRVGVRVSRKGPNLTQWLRNKINLKAVFEFEFSAGADGVIATITEELTDSQTDMVYADPVKLPKVVEGYVSYELKVHVTTKVDQTDNPKQVLAEYRVWPNSLELEAVHDNNNAAADGFTFDLLQAGAPLVAGASTDNQGKYALTLTEPGEITLEARSPWILDSREVPTPGRKWKVKVTQKPWTASFHQPTGPDIRQWVNQAAGANSGSLVRLEIGPQTLAHGQQNQEIKIKATFSADNSKRDDPMPALQTGANAGTAVALTDLSAAPGLAELVYEHTLRLPANGQPVICYLQLGVAGGDTCKVEIGVTDSLEDDAIEFTNWRKLKAEMVAPDNTMRGSAPDLLVDNQATLATATENKLAALLDPLFVELECPPARAHTFVATNLDGEVRGIDWETETYVNKAGVRGQYFVVDGARVRNMVTRARTVWFFWTKRETVSAPLTGNVFIASTQTLNEIRNHVTTNAATPSDMLKIKWCDFIVTTERRASYYAAKKLNYTMSNDAVEGLIIDPLRFHVFEHDPCAGDGRPSIRKLQWKVHGCRKVGDPNWIAPVAGIRKTTWKHPNLATAADVARYVTIHDSKRIELHLPNTAPGEPGNWTTQTVQELVSGVLVNVDYECRIQVIIFAVGFSLGVLGAALRGDIALTLRGASSSDHGVAHTIVHEIGHNLGTTYIENLGVGQLHDTPPGTDNRGRSTANEISGLPFANTLLPDGPFYAGKGFAGAHCAIRTKEKVEAAITDPVARQAVYDEPNWGQPSQANSKYFEIVDADQCIMYATTDPAQTKAKRFCDDCTTYLKATDASDITKNWKV